MNRKLATVEPHFTKSKKQQRQVSMTEYGFRQTVYDVPIRPLKRKRTVQLTLDTVPRAMSNISLAIVGSRTYVDFQGGMTIIRNFVDWLARERNMLVERIVSGGARGADAMGELYAKEEELPLQLYHPDITVSSPSRYHQRNQMIVDDADAVLALWDEESNGTRDTLKRAQRKPIPVYVYNFKRPDITWSEYELRQKKRPKKSQ